MLSLALVLFIAAPSPAVDALTKGSLRLLGRFSGAHACPTEPRIALTNGHVIDLRPFDADVPAFPYAYSDGAGNSGFLVPTTDKDGRTTGLERGRDLATVEPLREGDVFANPLRVASNPPQTGDRVFLLGFSWKNKKSLLDDDVIEAKVTRVVALHVAFYPSGQPGSSGSCIVNEAGEVVAINEGAYSTDDGDEVGLGVGVWGNLSRLPQ